VHELRPQRPDTRHSGVDTSKIIDLRKATEVSSRSSELMIMMVVPSIVEKAVHEDRGHGGVVSTRRGDVGIRRGTTLAVDGGMSGH
jgi:hypothetical protein